MFLGFTLITTFVGAEALAPKQEFRVWLSGLPPNIVFSGFGFG